MALAHRALACLIIAPLALAPLAPTLPAQGAPNAAPSDTARRITPEAFDASLK